MSPMEQALRDEIAWHEQMIRYHNIGPAQPSLAAGHERRLAALTAALPAPGDAGGYDAGFRAGIDAAIKVVLAETIKGDHYSGLAILDRDLCMTISMRALSAAPHPPVSLGEISQAQAQTMREALAVVDAARCIQHWHDRMIGQDEGMVVSAEHVRLLWKALAVYDAALSASPLPAPATPGGPDAE